MRSTHRCVRCVPCLADPLTSHLASSCCLVVIAQMVTELKKINDWPTFPQIVVHGELIGGLDIVKEM